jgi:hypothetical protein
MGAIHKALIEAIVYIETSEGTDDQEDDDVRALESVFYELSRAEPDEIEAFIASARAELAVPISIARQESLQNIIESLSDQ